MHSLLTRGGRLALASLVVLTSEVGCQSTPAQTAAVNTVMDFRLNWVGDSTPFNACSAYQAVGRPADFPAGILPGLRRGLDRPGNAPCEGRTPGTPGAWRPEVVVDSVSVRGETAIVYVTVRKDEISYREDYSLVNPSSGRWGMNEVRTWGAVREYPCAQPFPCPSSTARYLGTASGVFCSGPVTEARCRRKNGHGSGDGNPPRPRPRVRADPREQLKPRPASASEPRRGLSLSQQRVYPLIGGRGGGNFRYTLAASAPIAYLRSLPSRTHASPLAHTAFRSL